MQERMKLSKFSIGEKHKEYCLALYFSRWAHKKKLGGNGI